MNLEHLAELIYESRQSSVLKNDTRTIDGVLESLRKMCDHESDIMNLIAYDDAKELLGWLCIWTDFPLMAFISGWYPVVHPNANETEIALALIKASIPEIRDKGFTRLEIMLENLLDVHDELAEKYISWYTAAGFTWAAEEITMSISIDDITKHALSIPEELKLVPLDEITNEEIYPSYFVTFEDSKDDLYLSMSLEEQKVTFEHWFDRTRPFHTASSLVLKKDKDVIGHIVVRSNGGQFYIGPLGIHPDYRKKGLGTILMQTSLSKLKESDAKMVSLDVSASNKAAIHLYEKLCFKKRTRKLFYFMNL